MSRLLLDMIGLLLGTFGIIGAATYIFSGLDKPKNKEECELARRGRTILAVTFELLVLIAIFDFSLTEGITP